MHVVYAFNERGIFPFLLLRARMMNYLVFGLVFINIPCRLYAMLLKSTAKSIQTPRGPRTINETIKRIACRPDIVFKKICDFSTWPEWISPNAKFNIIDTESTVFSSKGQSCEERFGLFRSSQIIWTVSHIEKNKLTVYSSYSKRTFGWDTLEMEFTVHEDKVQKSAQSNNSSQASIVSLVYSWTVPNPIVSILERAIIRHNMMDDNIDATYKLAEICAGHDYSLDDIYLSSDNIFDP